MTGLPRASGFRLIRVVIVCIAVAVIMNTVVNLYLYLQNQTRVDQVCDLVVNTHVDRVKRYDGTLAYLQTPAGRERTALNDYIRLKSLPQTRAEVIKEREGLPPTCVAGRKLPEISKVDVG